jgi:hypothetical protein
MPAGETTTATLVNALPTIIADARIVREFEGTWMRTTDVRRQNEGEGLSWIEDALQPIAATDITETTTNNNPQQVQDALISVEPTMVQVLLKVTDRTYRKIAKVVSGKIGTLCGNAMARKKDEDYLALFSTFSTGTSPGSGQPVSFGHIAAAKNRITSNATEPSNTEVYAVLHGFQIKDIQDEVLAGVGTYTVPEGLTEDTFRKGFMGTVAGANVFEDGNIAIDATPNARGAVHSKEAVVAVMGMSIKTETRRDPSFGGGADEIFMTDEYAFVERSAGNWAYTILSDATAPTS